MRLHTKCVFCTMKILGFVVFELTLLGSLGHADKHNPVSHTSVGGMHLDELRPINRMKTLATVLYVAGSPVNPSHRQHTLLHRIPHATRPGQIKPRSLLKFVERGTPTGSEADPKLDRYFNYVIHDPNLQAIVNELWALEGSSRHFLGEGPLLPAIRKDRFPLFRKSEEASKTQPYSSIQQGQILLEKLEAWINENTVILKIGGSMRASDSDKEVAEKAMEDLQVALGTLAEAVLISIDNSTIAALANPRYNFSANSASESDDMHDSETLQDSDTYVVNKKRNYHRVCILHGNERLFEHDAVRDRIRAIKIRTHDSVPSRTAEVFVDAVAMDLEAEREKHPELSRQTLLEWANALYKARLLEAKDRESYTDSRHKFERKLWVAVARVLGGKRQKFLHDEDI